MNSMQEWKKRAGLWLLGDLVAESQSQAPAILGEVRTWNRRADSGLLVESSYHKNVVVLAGLSMTAKSIQHGHADQGKSIRYLALGTGETNPSKSDTALVTELTRKEYDTWDNTNIAGDPVVMIFEVLFGTSEGNGTLTEAGLFQESSGAPMFCRSFFGYGLITAATKTNPVRITSANHGLADSYNIKIRNVGGMVELNGNTYYVDVIDANTFDLYSDAGLTTSVDGTGYSAYTSGGEWFRRIIKTSSETLSCAYTLTFPAAA